MSTELILLVVNSSLGIVIWGFLVYFSQFDISTKDELIQMYILFVFSVFLGILALPLIFIIRLLVRFKSLPWKE